MPFVSVVAFGGTEQFQEVIGGVWCLSKLVAVLVQPLEQRTRGRRPRLAVMFGLISWPLAQRDPR